MTNDPSNEWIARARQADGIILASPTHFANVCTEMKAFINRVGMVCLRDGRCPRRKMGAPVAAARRGGAVQAYNTLLAFFGINSMVVPTSACWNFGFGLNPGEVANAAEGMQTMRELGENMAWTLKNLHGK